MHILYASSQEQANSLKLKYKTKEEMAMDLQYL